MTPRIQLSLTFDDVDFFYNYVKPVKDNKEITPLIMRLLEAYFLDPNVRQSVDSYGLYDLGVDTLSSADTDFNEALQNAKSILAVMSVMSESAQDSIAAGQTNIESILSQAEDAMASAKDVPTPQITMQSQVEQPHESVVIPSDNDVRLNNLEKAVSSLTDGFKSIEQLITTMLATQQSTPVAKPAEAIEDVTVSVPQSVEEPTTSIEDNVNSIILDDIFEPEDETPQEEDVVSQVRILAPQGVEDATTEASIEGIFEDEPVSVESVETPVGEVTDNTSGATIDGSQSLAAFLADFA